MISYDVTSYGKTKGYLKSIIVCNNIIAVLMLSLIFRLVCFLKF